MENPSVRIGKFTVELRPAKQGNEHGKVVAFYDATARRDVAQWVKHGQFVSSYYLSTLMTDREDLSEGGLCLDGGNADVWTVPAESMRTVFKWLEVADAPPKTKKQVDTFIHKLRKPPYEGQGDGRRSKIPDRHFPREKDVLHQFMIAAQAPDGVTVNEDGDISSRSVTDWYVKRYMMLNRLKAA